MMPELRVLCGDWLEQSASIADNSVHCCVTSPPYFQLRNYGIEGQIGLEKTPEEYVDKLVKYFREVRRVLRDDGTLWMNIADTYACGKPKSYNSNGYDDPGWNNQQSRKSPFSLKPKDLIGIPWLVAFALREDGWWLRSEIIWVKPNPMPESVTDRPTKSHEQIFLLTKNSDYFYDAEAVKEAVTGTAAPRMSKSAMLEILKNRANGMGPTASNPNGHGNNPKANGPNSRMVRERTLNGQEHKSNASTWNVAAASTLKTACSLPVTSRNKRDVWTVASMPYREAHYATFPPDLIKPCILAGTSASGCCAQCGAPRQRIVENGEPDLAHQRACGGDQNGEYDGQSIKDYASAGAQNASETKARILRGMVEKKTVGWEATCKCEAGIVPCVVLDPFAGSGTTAMVAMEFGLRNQTNMYFRNG